MPNIERETGSITYENTAIKMQERIEGDDLYSPLYPRELASNIKWNENTLTLPNETGNSTYETKYRALDYIYAGQYLFALNNCIYKYTPDTKTLSRIYYFYQELDDDYFVDISMREGNNTSTFYLISHSGKIYSFPANNWYDTGLTDCTGIVHTNNQMFISTQHGLYRANWNDTQNFEFTQIQVANFALNENFAMIDVVTYGTTQQIIVIATDNENLAATTSYNNPSTFTKVADSIAQKFHGYKNIIPELNLVIFIDGVWHTTDITDSALNTGDLRNLQDTQYIYYIKKWSASHYECSNNKWNMTVGYDATGNIVSSASYSNGAPMYVLFPNGDLDWCLTINNRGTVYHTTESGTTVFSTTIGTIQQTCYRAPRYNYHVDVGDSSNSTQEVLQNLNGSMAQEGRIFDNVPNIPFTFANYTNRYYLTSEPIISENGMQCLYNVETMDTYIFRNNKWNYINLKDRIAAVKLCYSLYSNYCWYNNELWGLFGVPNNAVPYIFRYNPVSDTLYYYTTNISVTNASPLSGWSIAVNSDNIVFSTGLVFSDGEEDDADSAHNFGIYSTAYTSNLDNASWTKVSLSTNLNEYTAVNNLQTVKINGKNIIYAISTTGYDGDGGRVSRLISNTLISSCSSDVLGKTSYQYIPAIKVGKLNSSDVALIPESKGVRYTSDFTNVSIKNLDNNMSCPKVEYLSKHNKWIVYESSIDELENLTPQYQYMILSGEDLSLQGDLGIISLTAFTAANSIMCSNMTPWIYEQDNTYINICLPNGMIGHYTINNNTLTYGTLEQTYINSNHITLHKVIQGVDKYILLYSFNPYNVFDKMPKASCVCYSNNGIDWYGGYNFDGYYNDMCYSNGQLWIGGWDGIDDNSTFIPSILYSGELAVGNVDMINYGNYNSTDVNLSITDTKSITNLQSSIATSGNTVCMVSSYNDASAITYIMLEINGETMVSSAIANIQGFCSKIVAGTSNSYFYILQTSSQRLFQELIVSEDSTTRTTRGTYTTLTGMIGVSEYDPVHDGICIFNNTGVDIYTQGKIFHIGNIGNTSNANQVGYFHGRYLYNILDGSTTKSAYGIVPWFNTYPHDCKYLDIIIQTLCICDNKCFVITSDNKLYISSAI